jgi:fluoroquinolone transport system permease protein
MRSLVLIKTDFKNIIRDRSLLIIFAVPLIIAMMLRFLPPIYESYFPEMIRYRALILGVFAVLVSLLAGLFLTFVMLDEKDQSLFPVFRITPFSFEQLTLYRIAVMGATSFIFSIVLIKASGIISMQLYQEILLSATCSLAGPTYSLLILGLAHNKIEGVTYYKLLNTLMAIPIIGLFIDPPFRYLFGIIPYFWVYMAFDTLNNAAESLLYTAIALVLQGICLIGAYRFFLIRNQQ